MPLPCSSPTCVREQSCHNCEEDEGGEDEEGGAEDEMSFEVRQSELVKGSQGLGFGTHRSGSSPRIE